MPSFLEPVLSVKIAEIAHLLWSGDPHLLSFGLTWEANFKSFAQQPNSPKFKDSKKKKKEKKLTKNIKIIKTKNNNHIPPNLNIPKKKTK